MAQEPKNAPTGRDDAKTEAARNQQAQQRSQARSEAETEGTNKETIVKAPDTPVPSDGRGNWGELPVGETNRDPRGIGQDRLGSGNFTADPTDNRAGGKASASHVRDRALGDEEEEGGQRGAKRRELPRQSPDTDALARSIPFATPVSDKNPLGIRTREVEYLEGETVRLTAAHYINDVLYEDGTVFEDYEGPKSRNMEIVEEGKDYQTAAKRAAELQSQRQANFKVREQR